MAAFPVRCLQCIPRFLHSSGTRSRGADDPNEVVSASSELTRHRITSFQLLITA
jgi:hypothetical protein